MTASHSTHRQSGDVWRLRRDLRFLWVDGRSDEDGYWVVRDPLASEWFCLSTTEKMLLELADGFRSIRQLCCAAKETLVPSETGFDALVSFYVQARRKGLLVSIAKSGPIDRAIGDAPATRSGALAGRLGKLVAYRLPGLNPNTLIGMRDSRLRIPDFRILLGGFLGLVFLSIAILVSNFDQLSDELAGVLPRHDPMWLAMLIVVIVTAKSVHELAHVAACRLVGAECREIGVMLLFGAPCLYCDVTDLWSVPRRRDRIIVSAAGMLAELVIASFATMIWAVTAPSTLHDLALTTMIVCSISTVMINANPLLRYDGYFILSDWVGAPNLAAQAASALRGAARTLVWGRSADSDSTVHVGRSLPNSVLLMFGISSAIYRAFVVAVITLVIYHQCADNGLGWLGIGFAAILAVSMFSRVASHVLRPPSIETDAMTLDRSTPPAVPTRWWKHPRAVAVTAGVVVLGMMTMTVPLRRHVVVPVLVVAAGQQEIHAVESGTIVQWADAGTNVAAGEILLRLTNHDIEDQLRQADADLAVADATVLAWRSRRGSTRESSAALALATQRRTAAEQTRRHAADRVQRLTIQAEFDGRFTPRHTQSADVPDLKFHRGQWIPAGTVIGWVGHAQTRSGIALVRQDQVELIRLGQRVRIRHASFSAGRLDGLVRHVDPAARQMVAPELAAVTIDSSNPARPQAPNYIAKIEFDTPELAVLPLRSVLTAEIEVDPASLWNRLRRIFAAEFRGL